MDLPRKRRSREVDGNVVPLINIVFLLLVFFILTGTLESAEPFEVIPPQTTTGPHLEKEGLTILIARDGRIALGGELIAAGALADRLRELGAAGPKQRIKVKADGATLTGHVMPVLQTVREAGFDDVVLVTVTEKAG